MARMTLPRLGLYAGCCILAAAVAPMLGCTSAGRASAPEGMSLATADVFHYRLHWQCRRLGYAALYRGALAALEEKGLEPVTRTGCWDIVPLDLLIATTRVPTSSLLRESDIPLALEAVPAGRAAEDAVKLTVNGQTIFVQLQKVSPSWHFPAAETTALDLLESCSDSAAPVGNEPDRPGG
jgi:hypothetical protein